MMIMMIMIMMMIMMMIMIMIMIMMMIMMMMMMLMMMMMMMMMLIFIHKLAAKIFVTKILICMPQNKKDKKEKLYSYHDAIVLNLFTKNKVATFSPKKLITLKSSIHSIEKTHVFSNYK